MRKLISVLMALCLLLGGYIFLNRDQYLLGTAVEFTEEHDLAFLILEGFKEDKMEITIKNSRKMDTQYLFNVLESIYPYAFSVEIASNDSGRTHLDFSISNKETQDKGRLLAETKAKKLVHPTMTMKEKLVVLHDNIILNTAYDEPTADNPKAVDSSPFWAYGALFEGKAVCAGYSRAFAMMASAVGIDMIYVTSEDMNHGWNALRIDGKTYFIDITFDDPVPDRPGRTSDQFFLIDEAQLEKTHSWDKTFCEKTLDKLEELG